MPPRSPLPFRILAALLLACASLTVGTTTSLQTPANIGPAPAAFQLPNVDGSVKFAVIGDSGTGGRRQYEVAERLALAHGAFPFTFVIMLGDNLYGSERPGDYERKFERPYAPLLAAGVKFYAALGNHDELNQRYYKPFNMNGQRYYTHDHGDVRFFVLDSNYLDPDQLAWLERELAAAGEPWKIAYFHHPLYSSGERHGSEEDLRELLEPLFLKYGVSAVFAGHEHFYERLQPQKGIQYFISGAAGKLRRNNLRENSALTARGFDTDYSFMLVEIAGDELHFECIARDGRLVDRGVVPRLEREMVPSR